jgi:hypothetical protein
VKTLAVFATLPAPPETAAWLRNRLEPVVKACKFARPVPLELRPTGKFRGWCGVKNYYRDGRVCITSQAMFWRPDQLLEVYLHECSHRLLEGREIDPHGPEFFALTAALYMRAAHLFERDAVLFLQIYDFQDVPDEDKGEVLDWALQVAKELAASSATAEELAEAVCKLWPQNVKEREATKAKNIAQIRAHISLKKEILQIKSKLFLWRSLSAIGWGTVIFITYFSLFR